MTEPAPLTDEELACTICWQRFRGSFRDHLINTHHVSVAYLNARLTDHEHG